MVANNDTNRFLCWNAYCSVGLWRLRLKINSFGA